MRLDMDAHPAALRRARRSSGDRLREALLALARGHGRFESHAEKAWASITFAGTRHSVRMVFKGSDSIAAGEQFITELPEHEFAIAGHLVADATIVSVQHNLLSGPKLTIECEVLLLEDE